MQSPNGRGGVRGGQSPFLSSSPPLPHSSQPEFVNVCFWFVPPSLRGKQESPDYSERLAKVGFFSSWLCLTQFGELMQLVRFCPLLTVSGMAGLCWSLAPEVGM